MAVKKKSAARLKKEAYWARLIQVAGKYKNALFVDSDNVSSKQISNLRKRLREVDAYMIMGKNVSIIDLLAPTSYILSRNNSSFNHYIVFIL